MYSHDAEAIIRSIQNNANHQSPFAEAKTIFEHAIAIKIAKGIVSQDTTKAIWHASRAAAELAGDLCQNLFQEKQRYW